MACWEPQQLEWWLNRRLECRLSTSARPRPAPCADADATGGPCAQVAQGVAALVQAAALFEVQDFLWDAAFPRLQAAGLSAAFLAALVPRILQGHLAALSPEVVQARAST